MMIQEIFRSVQGEGVHMGKSAVFIRVAGCNLSCPFCDSKETWGCGTGAKQMTINEIVNMVFELDPMSVCQVIITGGEPTLYGQLITEICTMLDIQQDDPRMISIETNGTLPVPAGIDFVSCSPKAQNKYRIECNPDEIKLVVDEDLTEEVLKEIVACYACPIFLQPESCKAESVQKALHLMKIFPDCRLGIQAHKYWDLL